MLKSGGWKVEMLKSGGRYSMFSLLFNDFSMFSMGVACSFNGFSYHVYYVMLKEACLEWLSHSWGSLSLSSVQRWPRRQQRQRQPPQRRPWRRWRPRRHKKQHLNWETLSISERLYKRSFAIQIANTVMPELEAPKTIPCKCCFLLPLNIKGRETMI